MRACVVGGGLAGSLLAWRLALAGDWRIDLLVGDRPRADATAASGGAVRAFETDPDQRRLAIDSMAELLSSPTLRTWAGFRRTDSVYLLPADDSDGPDGSDGTAGRPDLSDIEPALPGSARIAEADELTAMGFGGLAGRPAVVERDAGYTSPARLRDSVLRDGALLERVSVLRAHAGRITPADRDTVTCGVGGAERDYDVVVLAAGAWTAGLLRASGLPAGGYRTKSIQYGLYPVTGRQPPIFVDAVTGLYGRPTADGELLLGLPTDEWDVEPEHPETTPELHEAAAAAAAERLPELRLGPPTRLVGAVDCYTDPGILRLRPVVDTGHRLFTFSGGSGGSVKTALAASARAADQLVGSLMTTAF